MDIYDMHLGVNVAIDKIATNSLPDLSPLEIDYYLNRAIRIFCRQTQLQLLEGSFSSQEDIRSLIKSESTPIANWTQNPKLAGSYRITLPTDLFLVTDFVIIAANNHIGQFVSLQTLMQVSKSVTNQMTTVRKAVCSLEGNDLVFIEPWQMQDPSQAVIGYMRAPEKVSLNDGSSCDLPEHTHDRIVTLTVNEIMTDIKLMRPPDERA
jgi:hypothetical protein